MLTTGRIMQWVIAATLPGLLALTLFFGWGYLINVLWCALVAMATEALILALRKRPIAFFLSDGSAALTGVLLGLALPPLLPWWISLIAAASAIILAKQLYGGLGSNLFNPAMVGYALVLISFPEAMTTNWAQPLALLDEAPGLLDTLSMIAGFSESTTIDGITGATPLDVYKHEIGSRLASTVTANPIFGDGIARGWEWVNLGFLAGGLFLIRLKIITWHIPVSFLGALTLMALLFGYDPDQSVPVQMHLFAGATMLCAFFIATDPVSAATSNKGKLWYGAGIGILLYTIRAWGSYPDAVAFAVLLMNVAVPFIDYYTRPRTYGHRKPQRGLPS